MVYCRDISEKIYRAIFREAVSFGDPIDRENGFYKAKNSSGLSGKRVVFVVSESKNRGGTTHGRHINQRPVETTGGVVSELSEAASPFCMGMVVPLSRPQFEKNA